MWALPETLEQGLNRSAEARSRRSGTAQARWSFLHVGVVDGQGTPIRLQGHDQGSQTRRLRRMAVSPLPPGRPSMRPRRAQVRFDGDDHPDEAGEGRRNAHQERHSRPPPLGLARAWSSYIAPPLSRGIAQDHPDRHTPPQHGDGHVLPLQRRYASRLEDAVSMSCISWCPSRMSTSRANHMAKECRRSAGNGTNESSHDHYHSLPAPRCACIARPGCGHEGIVYLRPRPNLNRHNANSLSRQLFFNPALYRWSRRRDPARTGTAMNRYSVFERLRLPRATMAF